MNDPRCVRLTLIGTSLLIVACLLVLPLIFVFHEALKKGWDVYLAAIRDPNAIAAMKLTLLAAFVALPLNLIFGLAAAWAIARFEFRGKGVLTALVDLPFAVSPVIAGLVFVLLYGRNAPMGPWLAEKGWHIIFAPPGIILATIFVTLPFVAKELIPVLESQGRDEEEAAATLGAGGIRTFLKVTLPNIRWGLLYGITLLNARAMGEFGAVSVVSGHIRGVTNTLPLHVEVLYNEYNTTGAFAAASLLTGLALLTLILKTFLEWRLHEHRSPIRP